MEETNHILSTDFQDSLIFISYYVCAQLLSHVWLFATPWTVALQVPLSMGFSRQEYWCWLPFPTSGDLPDPGIKPMSLVSPALAGRFFTIQFSSVQSLSHVRLFATPWIVARQASLSITNSRSSLRLMSIESVMPSSHLIFTISATLIGNPIIYTYI